MCNTPGKPTMFNRREMIALGAVGAASLMATNRPVVADAPADVKFTLPGHHHSFRRRKRLA